MYYAIFLSICKLDLRCSLWSVSIILYVESRYRVVGRVEVGVLHRR